MFVVEENLTILDWYYKILLFRKKAGTRDEPVNTTFDRGYGVIAVPRVVQKRGVSTVENGKWRVENGKFQVRLPVTIHYLLFTFH